MNLDELNEQESARTVAGWTTTAVMVALFYGSAYVLFENQSNIWLAWLAFQFGGSLILGMVLTSRPTSDRVGGGIVIGTMAGFTASLGLTLILLSQIPID